MYKNQILLYLCGLMIFNSACKTTKPTIKNSPNSLAEVISNNPLFAENFSGIHIEALDNRQIIYQQFSNHRFIPASNIKILTLYAALETLNEKIPAFQYLSQQDTLWIWGTGDPAFLYDKVAQDLPFSSFLQSRTEKVMLLSHANFMDDRFGAGWAWEDYPYAFQVEKTPFPIYGNRVTFHNPTGNDLSVSPPYFTQNTHFDPKLKNSKITRAETENQFSLAENLQNRKFKTARPFNYQPGLTAKLLSDTLNRLIKFDVFQRILPKSRIVVERSLSDELYQQMMQESDNFIAEQLLLVIGGKLTDTLNTYQTIQRLKQTLFWEIEKDIRWTDGSGLSRYNLLTPRSIAWVLRKLSQKLPQERLLDLFPAGGKSGSLKGWYGGSDGPFVFAKTGSMGGIYCLSGYLKTKKGRLLIISFMNNNFLGNSNKYKEAITPVLEWLYEN